MSSLSPYYSTALALLLTPTRINVVYLQTLQADLRNR